jgi:hypothetical protein
MPEQKFTAVIRIRGINPYIAISASRAKALKPAWFRDPLNASPTALRNWNNLLPSRQKEILRYLASLKSEAARIRNVDRAMRVLLGQYDRFMARSWKDGR